MCKNGKVIKLNNKQLSHPVKLSLGAAVASRGVGRGRGVIILAAV